MGNSKLFSDTLIATADIKGCPNSPPKNKISWVWTKQVSLKENDKWMKTSTHNQEKIAEICWIHDKEEGLEKLNPQKIDDR